MLRINILKASDQGILVSFWTSSIIEFEAKHDVPETGSLSSLREKVGSTCC
jgi:hypothetical protein